MRGAPTKEVESYEQIKYERYILVLIIGKMSKGKCIMVSVNFGSWRNHFSLEEN